MNTSKQVEKSWCSPKSVLILADLKTFTEISTPKVCAGP